MLNESQKKFIRIWSEMACSWGISRSMAEVHALLLATDKPLNTAQVMELLGIALGNANQHLRALVDFGLAYREREEGCRKDNFYAEKDIWDIMRKVIILRKKRELAPLIDSLLSLENQEETQQDDNLKRIVSDIRMFSQKTDMALENIVKCEAEWISMAFMTFVK